MVDIKKPGYKNTRLFYKNIMEVSFYFSWLAHHNNTTVIIALMIIPAVLSVGVSVAKKKLIGSTLDIQKRI